MDIAMDKAHRELLHDVISAQLTEEDALLWMVLIHTHEIHLRVPMLGDALGVTTLAPATQRQAASVIAALWPDRASQQAEYTFWYREYQLKTPYEDISDVPPHLLARLVQLREALLQDPRVASVVEERE
jgi:hypothetical protein